MIFSEANIKEDVNQIVWGIALRNLDAVCETIEKTPNMQIFGDFIDIYTEELSTLIIKHMNNILNNKDGENHE